MANYRLIKFICKEQAIKIIKENVGKRVLLNNEGSRQDVFTEGELESSDDATYHLKDDSVPYSIAGLHRILIPE